MEDWIPLLSVCVGGLIATIPLLLSLIVQMYIHVSENKQKKREAKIQLTLELMRNDIKVIQDNINNYLRLIDELQVIKDKAMPTSRTDEEVVYQFQKEYLVSDDKLRQLYESSTAADTIALAFGDDFFREYKNYRDECKTFFSLAILSPSEFINDAKSVASIISRAGRLHAMMRENIISLRE